jgi:hypothetical protein
MDTGREAPEEKSTVVLALRPPELAPSMVMFPSVSLWPFASMRTLFTE